MGFERRRITHEGLRGAPPDPSQILGSTLFYLKRSLAKGEVQHIRDLHLPDVSEQIRIMTDSGVSVAVVEPRDIRPNARFSHLILGEVEEEIAKRIGVLANGATFNVLGVGLVPFPSRTGSTVVVDLDYNARQYLLFERELALSVMAEMAGIRRDELIIPPHNPSIPIGCVDEWLPDDERHELYEAARESFPPTLEFTSGTFVTKQLSGIA